MKSIVLGVVTGNDPNVFGCDYTNYNLVGIYQDYNEVLREAAKLKLASNGWWYDKISGIIYDSDTKEKEDISEQLEIINRMNVEIKKCLKNNKTIFTHFGDDLDNKSSIYAIEKWAREEGILQEDENLNVERVPAGQIKEGMLNVDTGGHKGSKFDKETIVIDGNPANGVHSAAQALSEMGIYVPEQIVELADTMPNKVSALDSRSGLALVRYLSGEQLFKLAEAKLIDKSLTDEQIKEYDLEEAHEKQQKVIDTAVEKIKTNEVELPNGEKMVIAKEQILGGSAIAYELGYSYFASISKHFDKEKNEDGVTFAINAKPGLQLPDGVKEWGKELVEKYRIDEKSSGVFLNPNGQMLVAGGPKNPGFKIEDYTPESLSTKIATMFGVENKVNLADVRDNAREKIVDC